MLAEDSEEGSLPEENAEISEEDLESDIEEDIKPKGKKKPVVEYSSESEESVKPKKGVYQAKKMNPIIYKDTVDKTTKKIQREETHAKHKLNKSNYIQMIKEEMDDKPEEVVGSMGMGKKTAYMKEMEMLEKVETQNFTRMNMTKAQKKYQR